MADDFIPSSHIPKKKLVCEKCGSKYEVTLNCSASLCNECKEKHSTENIVDRHEALPRAENKVWSHGSRNPRQPCKIHKNCELVTYMYCNDCKVPCCITSLEENHKQHDCTELNIKYLETETRLNSFKHDLSESSLKTAENERAILKETLDICNENIDLVHTELNAAEERLQNTVAQSFAKLRQDLVEKQIECISPIQEKIEKSERQISEIENLISSTDQKIEAGGPEMIEYYPTPPTISSYHPDEAMPIPCFVFNENILDDCEVNLGKISFKDINESSSNESFCHENKINENGSQGSESDGEKVIKPHIKTDQTIDFRSFKSKIYGGTIEPVGNETAFVSCVLNATMYLYDNTGKNVRSITIDGSGGIRDIAVQTNGDIIISSYNNMLQHVSLHGKITDLINFAPFSPEGICLTDRDEIVVCMVHVGQNENNHVVVYTQYGRSKVREIKARDRNNKQLFTHPYRVVINDGQMAVLNKRENVLSVTQDDNNIVWVYDGGQVKQSMKFSPLGICRDNSGSILVTDDQNQCIHYIDMKEGGLIKIIMLMDYGLESPWGIGVDSQNGRIWCGSSLSQNIFTLKYLK